MKNPSNKTTLLAAYRVSGFRAQAGIGKAADEHLSFVITLSRRQKKQYALIAEKVTAAFMTDVYTAPGISIVVATGFISTLNGAAWTVRGAAA